MTFNVFCRIVYNSKFYLLNMHCHCIVRVDEYLLFVKIMQVICMQNEFKTAYKYENILKYALKKIKFDDNNNLTVSGIFS